MTFAFVDTRSKMPRIQERWIHFLRRGGTVRLPAAFKGASSDTNALLAELHTLSGRYDDAKATAKAARDELDAYPALRKALLTKSAREGTDAGPDQTAKLTDALQAADDEVTGLQDAQSEVSFSLFPLIEADAAAIRDKAQASIDKAAAKAAGHLAKAVEALAAGQEEAAVVKWTHSLASSVPPAAPSPAEQQIDEILDGLTAD